MKQTSSYKHPLGLQRNTFSALLDDGDAVRFFYDLKAMKQTDNTGAPATNFLSIPYKITVVLAVLSALSDKQIDDIMDNYTKTGDKLGIRVKLTNDLQSTAGNTSISMLYEIYLIKDNEKVGEIYHVRKYW